MKYLSREDITQRVAASFETCESPRLKVVLQSFVRHLHAFARETELTRDEWLYGIKCLFRAGQISDATRNEFMLASDVLGLTALVELMEDTGQDRTPINNLGPFYVENAPMLEFNADLRGEQPGTPTLLRGRVLGADGQPIAGAMINLWQAQADGLYDVQVPGLMQHRFRGWLRTQTDGAYQARTILPRGYSAPMDGPIGEMLLSTGRSRWRPAHWHFLIRAPGHQQLITELYPAGSPHLDDDVAFGPREGLVVDVHEVRDAAEAERVGMPAPFSLVELDFKLARARTET